MVAFVLIFSFNEIVVGVDVVVGVGVVVVSVGVSTEIIGADDSSFFECILECFRYLLLSLKIFPHSQMASKNGTPTVGSLDNFGSDLRLTLPSSLAYVHQSPLGISIS